MATVLGRFGRQVREHDWFAVLLELLIVIVGVFLGIQAANWNEGRKAQQEERRYYGQLIDDLRTDVRMLGAAVERSRMHDQAAEDVLAALDRGLPEQSDYGRFALDIHYAGYLFVPQAARRTYDELISTGNLGILRDEGAKRDIASYYADFASNRQWDTLLREQQGEYWRLTAGVVPRRVLQAALRDRLPNVSPKEAKAYLAEARRRPQIRNMLIGMAAHQERVRRDSEGQREDALRLIRELEPLAR